MAGSASHRPHSGVEIAGDFRDNLIIDRYDPVFASMRSIKREHLKSANSEDAVTWNVFRSLRQISSGVWLPELFQSAFPGIDAPPSSHAVVSLWQTVAAPPSLLLEADEGESEIDVVIEAPGWVWFIEAKLGGDASPGTTARKERNHVLRNIDVGSYYAGVRPFYFSLLIADAGRSKAGVSIVEEYRDLDRPRELLAGHRPDGLANLRGVSLLRWPDLADILGGVAHAQATRDDERPYARRAHDWLRGRGLAGADRDSP
jgi:hypothetical protein